MKDVRFVEKREKKKMTKKTKTELDALWRARVKKNAHYKCERCEARKVERHLEAHHYYGRRSLSVRFDTDNGFCLCLWGHKWAHSEPEEFRVWALGKRGYDWLVTLGEKSRQVKKWTIDEIEELKETLK